MVPDKETQERVVRDSGLRWVLVRPPRFVSRRRGQLRVLREGDRGRIGHVARHDLAAVLLDAAERPDYLRQAIAVGSQIACFGLLPLLSRYVKKCLLPPTSSESRADLVA
jgi:uncharacterized protein YbjT (DUF2867 family)